MIFNQSKIRNTIFYRILKSSVPNFSNIVQSIISMAFLLLSLVVSTSKSNAETVTAEDIQACAKPADDVSMITINISNDDIKGAKLRLQRDYVVSGGARDEQTRDGLLIAVDKDTFAPYFRSGDTSRPFNNQTQPDLHQDMIILISAFVSLEKVAINALTSPNYKQRDREGISINEFEFTLKKDLYTPLERPTPRFDQAFIARNHGAVTDIISCDQDGDVPLPICTHIFEVGAYDIKISYLRKELPKWSIYRQKVEKFLNCVTVTQ